MIIQSPVTTNASARNANLSKILAGLPTMPSPTMTSRYEFLDTRQVITNMQDMGFFPVAARVRNSRTAEGKFGGHEVTFRKNQDVLEVGSEVPQIVFLNSYDGSRKAELKTGVFRLVCSNGLLVASAGAKTHKFLHVNNYETSLMEEVKKAALEGADVLHAIEGYRGIELERGIYLEFAKEAASLRKAIDVTPETLLRPRRPGDLGKDLFTTFNVVQENLIRGGGKATNGRIIQPLNGIVPSNQLNEELWGLMEKYAAI